MVSLGQHSPRKALCSTLHANRPVRSWEICFQMVELMLELMWESLCNPRLGRESGKAGLREGVNEMRSAWYASTQVDAMAHRQRLTWVTPGGSSRTFAPAKNRLCCVKEVKWCCDMSVKWYRQSSETGLHPARFMRPNGAAESAEVDHILTELVRKCIAGLKTHACSPSPNILTKHWCSHGASN